MKTITKEELEIKLELHLKWLRSEEGGVRLNLYGYDLSYADLSEADLSKANLSYTDLSKANLYKVNLSEANLSDANLYKADLSDADLTSTKGIVSFCAPGHTLVAYKYNDIVYVKIGCKEYTLDEWLTRFEEIVRNVYSTEEVRNYGIMLNKAKQILDK